MEIKGFKILDEIHRGPVTTVFRAVHLDLERTVLLKVLNIQWRNETDLIERFRREARICARLDHPAIVKLFDFGSGGGSFYLSMEYVNGLDLGEFIRKQHPVPFSVILSITSQIINGLVYAHGRNALHRDIKPSNIMISGSGQVKITDFGLATVTDLPKITEQGQVVGSPGYMSPEQARNEALDDTSDLFSLGSTLYELCSARSPFQDIHIGATLNNILSKIPEPLNKIGKNIPGWYSDCIAGLMSKNKQERKPALNLLQHTLRIHQSDFKDPDLNGLFHRTGVVTDEIPPSRLNPSLRKKIKQLTLGTIPLILILILVFIWLFRINKKAEGAGQLIHGKDQEQPKISKIISDDNIQYNEKTNPAFVADVQIEPKKPERDIPAGKAHSQEVIFPEDLPGELFIIVEPWADVYIDNVYQETTPLQKALTLKAGQYTLELRHPNSQIFRQTIEIQVDTRDTLYTRLPLSTGYLDLQVLPWAEIYINDEYYETTPVKNPIILPAGRHILILKNPGYAALTDTIEIQSGRTVNKRIRLK
jgi:serine/threonine-protein kinase